MSALDHPDVVIALRIAWEQSFPDSPDAREQGGFVLQYPTGRISVERWPIGLQDEIEVPPHPEGKRGDGVVIASFHTHPNPPPDYQQEPSLTDIRAVRGDPDLRHPQFEGEYVISRESLYRINPDGTVEIIGNTTALLGTT